MAEERIVLVFDVGTQSARAMLVNNNGDILAMARKKYDPPYHSPHPDWAEQDADYYFEAICDCTRKLREEHPDLLDRAEACGVSTIRDTIVCVDSEGRPLRPAILWLDKRRAKGNPEFSPFTKLALSMVGMKETSEVQYQKSHINWIMKEEPRVWEASDKVLLLSGYLIYRLTGVMADAAANMVGHLPIDSKKRGWLGEGALIWPVFPVPKEKLPMVADTGDTIGWISRETSLMSGIREGLPLIATGSDRACEILGLGCVNKEQAAIGLGTTATVTYMSDTYMEPERFIPPYPAVIPGCWNPEIEIFRGYWLVSWFKKEFAQGEVEEAERLGIAPEELLNRKLKDVPPGCQGLLFQPYFTPNITMPTARGAMIGFSDLHTRIHIYRAIIEGINFALMDGMRCIEQRAGFRMKEVFLGGGGSKSDEICQITADMFGLPVVRTQTSEVTGIGCAIACFMGIGAFSDWSDAISHMVRVKERFLPDMSVHRKYDELYEEVFSRTYDRLKPLYRKLHDIYSVK